MTAYTTYAAHKLIEDILTEAAICAKWDEEYVTTPETITTVIEPAAEALRHKVAGISIEDKNQGIANYTYVARNLHIQDYDHQDKMYAGHGQVVRAIEDGTLDRLIEDTVAKAL